MSALAPTVGDEPGPANRPARQLVLDLPVVEGRALEDFLPAPCNRAAFEAVLAWPAWPAPVLLLIGPEASGKSHLAQIWADRAGAVWLRGQDLATAHSALARLGEARAACCDDADLVVEERALLHLLNTLVERRGHLLATARDTVPGWSVRLPDLRSRLAAAWTVRVEPPDDTLLAALLVKQLADRGLRAEPEVVAFLVARMERSFAGARRLVRALDRASLVSGRAIGPQLARAVLAELAEPEPGGEEPRAAEPIDRPSGGGSPWISG